ncbi:MAG TPA: MFS transporter [Candidatus Dormibacteraeota bacterium]|nr:MFS transporter [Candidatus Dormibacteraeota bacterium]
MSRFSRLQPDPPSTATPAGGVSTPVGDGEGGAPISEEAAAGIGWLLVASALLRVGAVSAGVAVQFDLSDLAGGHPSGLAVGLAGASQALPEMVFAPILARYADRLGRRRFLIGGPLLAVLGLVAVSLATHPSQVASSRLLEGIGAAAFVPTALGTIAAATAGDHTVRARASGAFEGATLLGYAGGFVVGPMLYHALHRGAFPLLTVFYFSASAICWFKVRDTPPLPVSPLRVVWRAIIGPGPVRAFLPAWLAINALVGAFYANISALLKRSPVPGQTLVHGFDERVIGLFLLGWVALLVVGIALWTPVLRRLGGPLTMRRAVPGAFLTLGTLFAMNHLPLWVAPLLLPAFIVGVLVQAGFGPAAVNYLADCSEALAADRSALMAFYTVTLAGGGALGAVLGGVMSRWLYVDGIILLGLLLAVVAWFSLGTVIRYERARQVEGAAAAAATPR